MALTSVVMGPYTTQAHGDMGADIIKIETPDGDTTRSVLPFKPGGDSGIFKSLNRGTRSIVLDLQHAEGRAACLELSRSCDVFIHSMRPQAIAKLGLEYHDVVESSPSIVYCKTGRYSGRAAYDDTTQAVESGPKRGLRRWPPQASARHPSEEDGVASAVVTAAGLLSASVRR